MNQRVVGVLSFHAGGGGVLQIGIRFRQPLEGDAARVGGGDDAFALAVLLQFAARALDVGADLRDLPVEKIAGLLDRLELLLVVEPLSSFSFPVFL